MSISLTSEKKKNNIWKEPWFFHEEEGVDVIYIAIQKQVTEFYINNYQSPTTTGIMGPVLISRLSVRELPIFMYRLMYTRFSQRSLKCGYQRKYEAKAGYFTT